jgi:hypothetical protein
MIGKITYALTRHEADTYRSQGLPREARDLYQKLRSCSPNLPPELRADIAIQLRQIELEIGCDGIEECQTLSDEQIAVIKQGWNENARIEEMSTCALEFYHLGHFHYAIEELKQLARFGGTRTRVVGAFAACLVRLHGPEALAAAADQIARNLFHDYRMAISFQIAIAEKAVEWGRLEHARSVLRHVHRRYRGLPPEIRNRLCAAARRLGSKTSPKETRDAGRREPSLMKL